MVLVCHTAEFETCALIQSQVSLLKPVDEDRKRGADSAGGPDSKKIKSK